MQIRKHQEHSQQLGPRPVLHRPRATGNPDLALVETTTPQDHRVTAFLAGWDSIDSSDDFPRKLASATEWWYWYQGRVACKAFWSDFRHRFTARLDACKPRPFDYVALVIAIMGVLLIVRIAL